MDDQNPILPATDTPVVEPATEVAAPVAAPEVAPAAEVELPEVAAPDTNAPAV